MNRLLPLLALTTLAGCYPRALSVPARTLPLESSAVLRPGGVSAQVAGGAHFLETPDVGGSAMARARVGLIDTLEGQAEGTVYSLGYDDGRDPFVGAGRAGLKWAPVPDFALVGGFGAGAQTYGAFVAPDVGIVAGWENPWIVPWGAARFTFSFPIDSRTIVVADEGSYSTVATNSWAWQLSVGLRVPVEVADRVSLDFLVGSGFTRLESLERSDSAMAVSVEAGVEVVFEPPDPLRVRDFGEPVEGDDDVAPRADEARP